MNGFIKYHTLNDLCWLMKNDVDLDKAGDEDSDEGCG